MILKYLEIQGFKSFPDRTHIAFNRGITAVVGPNGSGKSNISDAIRWVLGEQSSKSLRGSKMEDVVFAGAGSRRAMGSAEVSLTFDNGDGSLGVAYNEVTITRRYFRSGESEYYINRKLVRLRDIHELFMDTGLGRDGYSIIGQGRIDEILSVKSDQRREVFDEAAGISKYRYRREEAARRLADAQANLVRIGDIIAELEGRLAPLEKEAEKERRYNALRGELQGLEVSVIIETLDGMHDRLEQAKVALAALSGDLESSQVETAFLSARADALLQDTAALQHEIETLRTAREEAGLEASRTENEIALAEAELAHNERDRQRIRQEFVESETRQQEIGETIAAVEGKYQEQILQEEEQRRHTGELENIRNTLRTDGETLLKRRLQLEQEDSALAAQAAELKQAIGAAQASAAEIHHQLAILDGDDEERQQAFVRAERELTTARQQLQEKEEALPGLQNIVNGLRLKKDSREKRVAALNAQIQETTIAIADVKNRLRLLQELEREYEGFNKAVRFVMREKDSGRLRGIHGPVSTLLKVEDQYVTATEIALGAAMQNIVTDNEQTARSAIQLLKSRNSGRATFLPITAIRGNRLNEARLGEQLGFIGILSDVIEYDSQYRNIFQNLLGRTVLVETIDDAIAMARAYGQRFRIVTLDGQVIHSGGSMTGGSLNPSAGILSRANELQKLTLRGEEMEQAQKAAQAAYAQQNQEFTAVQYELEMAEEELRGAQNDSLRMAAELTHLQAIYENYSSDKGEREARREDMHRRIAELDGLIQVKNTEYGGVQQKIRSLAERIDEINMRTAENTEKLQAADSQIAQCREGLTRIAAESRASRDMAASLRANLAAAGGDKSRRTADLQALEERDALCREKIAQLQTALADKRSSQETQETAFGALLQKRGELEQQRSENDRAIRDENNRMLALEREQIHAQAKLEALENEEQTLITRLWDSYELTRTTARAHLIEIPNKAAAAAQIDALKRKIRSIGNIYPGAEAEFAAVSERYHFMTAQRDDVELSKREIEDIIGDINKKMTELFRQQFEVITAEFSKTFTEIFGGGTAKIELSDPKDILGSGIEIMVQPPGKSLKVLSLLSGGERALAAIALYFAILRVRPAPFCVLDEIESALDEVNVRRFARYLRTLTDDTQFIVISHRRGTMEAADMLYGVTMPQQGISRLLALNINEAEKEFIKD